MLINQTSGNTKFIKMEAYFFILKIKITNKPTWNYIIFHNYKSKLLKFILITNVYLVYSIKILFK